MSIPMGFFHLFFLSLWQRSCKPGGWAGRPDGCLGPKLGDGFKHFYFSPYLGKWSNLTSIFFRWGWNRQLGYHVSICILYTKCILPDSIWSQPTNQPTNRPKELFDLLDDGDGGIHTGEFFHGLARMKGGMDDGKDAVIPCRCFWGPQNP